MTNDVFSLFGLPAALDDEPTCIFNIVRTYQLLIGRVWHTDLDQVSPFIIIYDEANTTKSPRSDDVAQLDNKTHTTRTFRITACSGSRDRLDYHA